MKHILLLAGLFIAIIAKAQTNNSVQLYGFRQAVIPGTVQARDVQENGKVVPKKATTTYNYKLYLTAPANVAVYPSTIWLKGVEYAAKYETVAQTPVTVTNYNIPSHPQTKVLVPKTTQKVLQLSPISSVEPKNSTKAKTLAKTNDLVVEYKMKGKFYYSVVKELTEIEPQAMQ